MNRNKENIQQNKYSLLFIIIVLNLLNFLLRHLINLQMSNYLKSQVVYYHLMILKTLTCDGKQVAQWPAIDNNKNQNFSVLDEKGTCQYQNFCSIQKLLPSRVTRNEIKVNNKLCKQNGEYMEKITTVKFNDEVITLRDRYRFLTRPQQNVDASTQKRIHLFKKPLHCESKNEDKRRVTKNLPKNFIKAFLNYLESVKDEQNSELLDCKMKLFSSKQKYNNSFIQTIVDDPDLQGYFNNFLNYHAKDWIQKSKIRDKEVHLEAIQVFKKLYLSRNEKKSQNYSQLDFMSFDCDESQSISNGSKQEKVSDKQSIIANQSRSVEQYDKQQ